MIAFNEQRFSMPNNDEELNEKVRRDLGLTDTQFEKFLEIVRNKAAQADEELKEELKIAFDTLTKTGMDEIVKIAVARYIKKKFD